MKKLFILIALILVSCGAKPQLSADEIAWIREQMKAQPEPGPEFLILPYSERIRPILPYTDPEFKGPSMPITPSPMFPQLSPWYVDPETGKLSETGKLYLELNGILKDSREDFKEERGIR